MKLPARDPEHPPWSPMNWIKWIAFKSQRRSWKDPQNNLNDLGRQCMTIGITLNSIYACRAWLAFAAPSTLNFNDPKGGGGPHHPLAHFKGNTTETSIPTLMNIMKSYIVTIFSKKGHLPILTQAEFKISSRDNPIKCPIISLFPHQPKNCKWNKPPKHQTTPWKGLALQENRIAKRHRNTPSQSTLKKETAPYIIREMTLNKKMINWLMILKHNAYVWDGVWREPPP